MKAKLQVIGIVPDVAMKIVTEALAEQFGLAFDVRPLGDGRFQVVGHDLDDVEAAHARGLIMGVGLTLRVRPREE